MSTRNHLRGVKGCRRIRLTNSPPSASWLSRKCEAPTPHSSLDLNGLLQAKLYLEYDMPWYIFIVPFWSYSCVHCNDCICPKIYILFKNLWTYTVFTLHVNLRNKLTAWKGDLGCIGELPTLVYMYSSTIDISIMSVQLIIPVRKSTGDFLFACSNWYLVNTPIGVRMAINFEYEKGDSQDSFPNPAPKNFSVTYNREFSHMYCRETKRRQA
jgi:hypothetical protein